MKKKMLMPVLMWMISASAFGQVKIAPEVGMTMYQQTAKMESKNTSTSATGNMLPGVRAGVGLDLPVSAHFSVQPGLFYSLHRTKFDDLTWGGVASFVSTRTLHNIELPIYFQYKSGSEGEGRFFAGIGPVLNYAISGNSHNEYQVLGVHTEEDADISFGDDRDKDDMHAFNVSAGANVGYELPMGLFFRANYNLGLLNLAPGGDKDFSLKDMSFGISIGYYFDNL